MEKKNFDYDVALSFAGEDRQYAESLAKILTDKGVRVFYDKYEQAELWGKDLYQHLQVIYRDKARYFVAFFSENYINKAWSKHELRQAQERAFKEDSGYILPVRIDDTPIPGINETIGFIDLREYSIAELAELVLKKLSISSVAWMFYSFIRETNPQVNQILQEKSSILPLLVSSSRTYTIEKIISSDGFDQYVEVRRDNSLIMNGVGIRGYVMDIAGQPWTGYIFTLKTEFYQSISL